MHRSRVATVDRSLTVQTAKRRMAQYLIFTAAGLSFLLSLYLWFTGQRQEGQFVGLWAPTILAVGALAMLSFKKDKA